MSVVSVSRKGNNTDLLARIGHTPLLKIRLASFPNVEVLGKAEFFNPGGSVKDRPGLNMILEGERTGKLTREKVLLDSTSGNTGIAYAMICAHRGYRVKLCLPANASRSGNRFCGRTALNSYSPIPEKARTAPSAFAKAFTPRTRRLYFYPDQYNNPANWKAHYETTAPEIIEQTDGQITHFLAILGTSGTFTGTTLGLRRELPGVRCISVQPASPMHGIEGTKHMPASIKPGIYDADLADDNVWVETEDAYEMARRLAREEGLLVGVSAAANVVAANRLALQIHQSGKTATIVTILCDSGIKYLSEHFWND